ncbi:type III-A CRISPR-associated RAMP protein Csm5 [Thermotoga sp. SG1]|uniref:type III-A CRISPR-associated RAMP protein Csm5 n=1 Tax=Thermotoga sp. SG1 TaxID=126739 RepID=UPI000C75CF6E|nr:type III-A CRISPR-associated RAMP protein Csm5 [Thermotoga sp. SG1]PLV57147.1 type III-A CRISPR-associated RAMP protein Csm5 [Thermotoga sp. SG1]
MKVILQTLTPLHIGSGEKYPPCNLVVLGSGERKNHAVRLKTRKFLEIFAKHKELKDSLSTPLTPSIAGDLTDGIFYEVSLYSDFKTRKRAPEILELIHHPDGTVYIPGSSLKGAIRLALTWYVLKNNKKYLEKFRENVRQDISNRRRNFFRTRKFLDELFRFDHQNINSDYFRFLRISDSERIVAQVVVHDVGVFYMARPNNNPRTFPVEFVPIKKEFKFDITFAKDDYRYFLEETRKRYKVDLPESLEEILKIVDDFYTEVFKFEKERFEKAKENFKNIDTEKIEKRFEQIEKAKKENTFLIHVGYGGGLMANSLFILLDEETRKRVRNIIKNHGNDEAPLTRRYLVQEENRSYKLISPIGWCVLWLEGSQST